jgi:threonylcarbamoyladenosine tRNA methylthiotransferase MtaB
MADLFQAMIGIYSITKGKKLNKVRTVALLTQGCRANQAETSILEQDFVDKGYALVSLKDNPEIVVINSCTVTKKSDADTRKLINKVLRDSAQSKIALIGCQAQVHAKDYENYKNVLWIIGTEHKMDLLNILEKPRLCDEKIVMIDTIKKQGFKYKIKQAKAQNTRINIKIQDGCGNFCSYCIVPYARGPARSRDLLDVVDNVKKAVISGFKEIVLTGINIGAYDCSGHDLMALLQRLEAVSGLKRIRLSSIEPNENMVFLIDYMSESEKICNYLHIPMQSCADEILVKMKRHYKMSDIRYLCTYAKNKVKEICLGTDIIVGFPGESDQVFEDSYQELKQLPLDYMHVFAYSDRKGTASFNMKEKVNLVSKKLRSKRLRGLSEQKRKEFMQDFLNKRVQVLFEQEKNGYWTGITSNYIRVKVKEKTNLKNRFGMVELKAISNGYVLGDLLSYDQ